MKSKEIGARAANLALMEIGVGSFLHAWHLPFAGHFLSLNQAAVLSSGLKKLKTLDAVKASLQVSTIAALLKTLSPAGKKLTPMLALSAQGFCYSLGVFVFGANRGGAAFGGAVLSVWAFLQPLLLYALLFGKGGLTVVEFYLQKLQPIAPLNVGTMFIAFLGALCLKAAVAAGLCAWAYGTSYRLPFLTASYVKKMPQHSFWRTAFGAILKPGFLLPIGLTIVFLLWSQMPVPTALLFVLRPVALGLALLLFAELFPWEKAGFFKRWFPKFSRSFRHAREELRRTRS